MKWIFSDQRKWNCDHINKCDILLDTYRGELILYNTDYPEPDGLYKYVFLNELDFKKNKRSPIPCDCKPENPLHIELTGDKAEPERDRERLSEKTHRDMRCDSLNSDR